MKNIFRLILTAIFAVIFSAACVNTPKEPANNMTPVKNTDGKIKIGFSMDTVKDERWQRDRAAFEQRCRELQIECVITVADNKADKQANDVDNLLTQGVTVLVIAPNNATQSAAMVDKAKAQGIPVISYDRLINSDKIDLYISHQVPVIGKKMAEYAFAKKPTGNYVMVYGDPADNNSGIMQKAQKAVLQTAIDKKEINIVAEQNAVGWSTDNALKIVENALTQNADKIDVVIASNDATARGAISALDKKGLTGKVIVTGQDAEKASLQFIAEGKQTMTVYKPIIPLANGAVDAAIKLSKKESLIGTTKFLNDVIGKEVTAILLEVTTVDKDNLMQTVIKDGFATFEDVYKNIPADQRPKQ